MALQSIEPSEIFRFLAETLARNGRIAPTTDSTLFESYKKHMQYWNGTTWSDRPVMNQAYLQAASDLPVR